MTEGSLVVDARALHGSGIGRYVRELVPRIAQHAVFNRVVLVGDPVELQPFVQGRVHGAEVLPLPYGRYDWRAQGGWLTLQSALPTGRRVIWFPHFDAPVVRMPTPNVVTIHDLIHLVHPGMAGPLRRVMLREVLRRVTRAATRVITVSDETRRQLLACDPEIARRVRVIANGGAEMAQGPAGALPSGVKAPFLLCVANRKPHKNLVRAVEVLAALVPDHATLTLVVAGEWFAPWNDVVARAEALDVRSRLVDVGVVTDDSLRTLYARCAAFLAPSYVEGFGIPVVEAMACGAPVVAADLPWAHAVGGQAVGYAHPMRTDEWVRAIAPLLGDAMARDAAIARGNIQGQAFTWDATARVTVDVLREAADA